MNYYHIKQSRNMNTNHHSSIVDRRSFLKGVGVSLALPFMDSLASASASVSTKPPIRLAFMYMPHGVIMDQFWPMSQDAFQIGRAHV